MSLFNPTPLERWLSRILRAVCLIACAIGLYLLVSCGSPPKQNTPPGAVSPDRVGPTTLPMPTSAPHDSAEWVRLTKELDDANAERSRLLIQLQGDENRKAVANLDTWKRFGAYSWYFIVAGSLLLAANFLPWTKVLFAGTSGYAFILIGGGTLFGALPHILETYGPSAFYPIAYAVGSYVALLLALDIIKRVRKALAEAKMATKVLDPKADEEPEDLIQLRAKNNPTFAAFARKLLPGI